MVCLITLGQGSLKEEPGSRWVVEISKRVLSWQSVDDRQLSSQLYTSLIFPFRLDIGFKEHAHNVCDVCLLMKVCPALSGDFERGFIYSAALLPTKLYGLHLGENGPSTDFFTSG